MFAPQLLSLKTSWMLAPQSGQNHPGAIERPAPHQLADSVSERVTAPRAATVSGGTNGVAAPSSSSSKRRENSIKPSGLPQPRDWRSVENSAEEVAARSADQQREQSRNAPHSSPQKRTHGAAAAATAGTPHHQKKRNASPRMAASSGALGGATSRPQQTSNPQPNRRVVVDVSEELHDNSASSSALGEIQNNSASAGSRAAAGAPGAATASRSLHKFGSSSVQFAPPGRQSLNAWRVGAPTTSSGSKGSTSSSSSTGGQQLQHPPQVVSASYTGVGPGASVMAGTSYGGAGVLNFKYAAGTVGGAVGGAVSGELHGNWIRPAQPPMLFYQTPMPQRSVTGGQYHPMYQPPSTYQVSTVQAAAGKPFYAGSVDGVPVASSATSATSVAVAAVGAGGTGGRAPAKDSGGPAVPQGSSSHFPLHQNRQKIPPTRVVVQAVAVASDKDRQVAERTGAVPTAKAATVVVHEKTGEVHEATSAHMKRPTAAAGGRLLSHRGRSPDVGAERRRQAQARESPGKAFTMEGEIEKERRSTIHHVGGVAPFSARRSRPSVKREHSIGAQPREASFHNDSASIQEHDVMYFDVNDAQYDDDEDGKGTTTLLELQEKMHLLKAELKQAKQESSLHAKNQRLAEKKAYEARSSLTEARKEIAQCQADMRKYWEENEKLAGELGEKKKQIEQLHLKLREEKNGKHQAAREVRELQRKIETLENRERMSKMSTTCESSDSMTNLAPQSSQQPLPRHSTHVALQETPRPSQNHFAHHLQNSASGPRHATHHLQHSAGSTQKSYGNGANDSGPSSALKSTPNMSISAACEQVPYGAWSSSGTATTSVIPPVTVSLRDLSEIKALKKPPEPIQLLFKACCLYLGIEPNKKFDKHKKWVYDYWEPARKSILSDTHFMHKLRIANPGAEVLNEIREMLEQEREFSEERVGMCCRAARPLFGFMRERVSMSGVAGARVTHEEELVSEDLLAEDDNMRADEEGESGDNKVYAGDAAGRTLFHNQQGEEETHEDSVNPTNDLETTPSRVLAFEEGNG